MRSHLLGLEQELRGVVVLGDEAQRLSDVNHVRDLPFHRQIRRRHVGAVLGHVVDIAQVQQRREAVQLDVRRPEPGLPVVAVMSQPVRGPLALG